MLGVVLAHAGEVAVSAEYGCGVFPVEGGHTLGPGYGVEQAAFDEETLGAACRQIFMKHQQIVAEMGLFWFLMSRLPPPR